MKAYLFGKGPSLERHLNAGQDELRVAVNDALLAVPDCQYVFLQDSVAWWRIHEQIGNTVPVLPPARIAMPPDMPFIPYVMAINDEFALAPGLRRVFGFPYIYADSCTAISAIHWLFAVKGITELTMIGFDGGVGYAPRFGNSEFNHDYDLGRIKWLIEKLNIKAEFLT